MAISRLAIKNPAAETPTEMLTATAAYVLSAIVANVSENQATKVDIWIAPLDEDDEDTWGYITKNDPIDPGNSFETFRFALAADDVLYIKSDNGLASFTLIGISQ